MRRRVPLRQRYSTEKSKWRVLLITDVRLWFSVPIDADCFNTL